MTKKIRRNKTFLNKIYMHTTCHARTYRNVIFFGFPNVCYFNFKIISWTVFYSKITCNAVLNHLINITTCPFNYHIQIFYTLV